MRDSTRLLPGSPRAAHDDSKHVYSPWADRPMTASRASQRLAALGTVLYAVAIGDEIKIGYTTNVVRRLDRHRSKTGRPCRLLAIRFGTRDDERAVHRSLRAHLAHGQEWYRPTPEVLALVNEWRSAMGQAPLAA